MVSFTEQVRLVRLYTVKINFKINFIHLIFRTEVFLSESTSKKYHINSSTSGENHARGTPTAEFQDVPNDFFYPTGDPKR